MKQLFVFVCILVILSSCKKEEDTEGNTVVNIFVTDGLSGQPLRGYRIYFVEYTRKFLHGRSDYTFKEIVTDSTGRASDTFYAELGRGYYISNYEMVEDGAIFVTDTLFNDCFTQTGISKAASNNINVVIRKPGHIKFKFINEPPKDTLQEITFNYSKPVKNFYRDTIINRYGCGETDWFRYTIKKNDVETKYERKAIIGAYDTAEVVITY